MDLRFIVFFFLKTFYYTYFLYIRVHTCIRVPTHTPESMCFRVNILNLVSLSLSIALCCPLSFPIGVFFFLFFLKNHLIEKHKKLCVLSISNFVNLKISESITTVCAINLQQVPPTQLLFLIRTHKIYPLRKKL